MSRPLEQDAGASKDSNKLIQHSLKPHESSRACTRCTAR